MQTGYVENIVMSFPIGVREAFWILILSDVGFASATLPREEEEPRVATYAAAEIEEIEGLGAQTEKTKGVL